MTNALDLKALGYTGALDGSGYVDPPVGDYTWHARAKLTEAIAGLLDGLKVGSAERPRFYVTTFEGSQLVRVKYRAAKEALDQTLLMDGIVEGGGVVPICGSSPAGRRSKTRHQWGPVPPVEQLSVLPTPASVRAFPDFWISGPGRAVAELVDCGHGYYLTDSCPNCDADLQQATPEQRQALLDVVLGPTPEERQREALKAAVELAHANAQTEMRDVQEAFAADVMQLGAVRATRLWARKAMRAQTAADVWQDAVDHGRSEGPWAEALVVAEQHAVRLLRESVHPTRNAVDKALCEVQGRTAAELLDTIESFRKAVR